jgi:hypothetical protein
MLRAGFVQCLEVSKGAEVTNSKRCLFVQLILLLQKFSSGLKIFFGVSLCAFALQFFIRCRFHLWSCDLQNLKLTIKENTCRTALNVMLRAEAKALETFKFIGRGSSEANLKPDQLIVLQQYRRAEEGLGVALLRTAAVLSVLKSVR